MDTSDFTFNFHFHALEKEMATHSSVLAWRIPGTGEPGGLPYGVAHSRTRLKWLSSSSSECRRHETWVQSLSWEDPLAESIVTHSSIPAWRITRTEEPRAWQATVHRVTQSQKQLKWLSTHTAHKTSIYLLGVHHHLSGIDNVSYFHRLIFLS